MINFINVLKKNKELKQKSQTLEIQNKELVSIIGGLKKENESKNELLSLFLDDYKIQSIINSFKSGEAFMEPIQISSYVDYDIANYFPVLKQLGYMITNEEIDLIKDLIETHDKLMEIKNNMQIKSI